MSQKTILIKPYSAYERERQPVENMELTHVEKGTPMGEYLRRFWQPIALSAELGEKRIRVYAVSPGPVRTRAASGIAAFDELIDAALKRTPEHRLVEIAEIGRVVAFLCGPGASGMTGDTIYVDAGLHNMA